MEPVPGPSSSSTGDDSVQSHRRRRRRNIFQPNAVSEAIPFSSPQKKRKQAILSSGERLMIINIFKYVQSKQAEDKPVLNHDLVKQTCEISGVSERSVYRVLSEYRDTHKITEPDAKRNKPNILQKVDDFDKTAIRRIVHGFYMEGELPTLKKILQTVNDDDSLPTLSMTSLRRILIDLNFKYTKKNRSSILIDRNDIVIWRLKYLKQIQEFRRQNRRIFYTDETWVNAGTYTYHFIIKYS